MSNAIAIFAIVSIIVTFAALIDYILKLLRRITDFSGKFKVIPKTFREVQNTLPILDVAFRGVQDQRYTAGLDGDTCATLLPLITDFRVQFERLKALLDKALPSDDDSYAMILWKAIRSIRKEKEVEVISIAIDRYVRVLTMIFGDPVHYSAGDLLFSGTVARSTLMSMSMNRAFGYSWDQRPIQLIDAMRRVHLVPFEFYKTTKVRERGNCLSLDKPLTLLF
jgi:hypothetical protein